MKDYTILTALDKLNEFHYNLFFTISNDDIYHKYTVTIKNGIGKENEYRATSDDLADAIIQCLRLTYRGYKLDI